VPDNQIERLVTSLREDLRNQFAGARSFKSTEDQIGRDFDRAENYLSLVGLIIVILGGIAVSSVTRVFIQQKMRAIAVLKCVGARSQQVIAVYVLQVLALGLAGSLLGVAIARAAVAAIPLALGPTSTSVLATVKYGISWSAALQGTASACWCRCCFRLRRCFTFASSSRRCCCATNRFGRKRIDWLGIGVLVMVAAGSGRDNRLAGRRRCGSG
jgi:putative ABC transport system permease protein